MRSVSGREHEGFELGAYGEAIDLGGLFGGLADEGFALYEFSFDGVERGEFVVVRLEVAKLGVDAEERADEIFDVRGELDDEFGAGFGGERGGIAAGVEEARVEFGRGFVELVEEDGVEAGEAGVREEVFEREPERRSQGAVIPRRVGIIHFVSCFLGVFLFLPNEPGTCL